MLRPVGPHAQRYAVPLFVPTITAHARLCQPSHDCEQALREIIEKKAKGEKIERPKQPARSNVVSLMDAPRASVDAEGRAGASKSRRSQRPAQREKPRVRIASIKRLARRPLVVAIAQQDVKRRKGEME
jgi:hypothetical protein